MSEVGSAAAAGPSRWSAASAVTAQVVRAAAASMPSARGLRPRKLVWFMKFSLESGGTVRTTREAARGFARVARCVRPSVER